MAKNHWFVTRPKRRLTLIADVLRVFMAVAEGEVWRGNKRLHLLFEEGLEENGLKTVGERRDGQGSGGRTYASWLYAFGLYFTDSKGRAWTTLAGEALLKNNPPGPILTNQLIKFQYPSPYSFSIRLSNRFRVFPYRFILHLLLHTRLNGYLTEKEVGIFASTLGATERDLNKVAEAIEIHRNLGSSDDMITASLGDGWQDKYTNKGKIQELIDVGNTMFNNLEITGFIERADLPGSYRINRDKIHVVREILREKAKVSPRYTEAEVFQRHYGLGLNNLKDIRSFSEAKVITHHDAEAKKVVWSYYSLLSTAPLLELNQSTFEQISKLTAVPPKRVMEIITGLGITPSFDHFEQRYIELAESGREGAKAFEQATAGIFGEHGLGLETEWVGYKPSHPDVTVSNQYYGGIIDAKAYSDYGLSGDHQRRMSIVYIPKYTEEFMKKNIPLKFFGYVAGNFNGNIDEGLKSIARQCQINGFSVTAKDLVKLVRIHREKPFTPDQLLEYFTGNEKICV